MKVIISADDIIVHRAKTVCFDSGHEFACPEGCPNILSNVCGGCGAALPPRVKKESHYGDRYIDKRHTMLDCLRELEGRLRVGGL